MVDYILVLYRVVPFLYSNRSYRKGINLMIVQVMYTSVHNVANINVM
jgi:hypothetical protein